MRNQFIHVTSKCEQTLISEVSILWSIMKWLLFYLIFSTSTPPHRIRCFRRVQRRCSQIVGGRFCVVQGTRRGNQGLKAGRARQSSQRHLAGFGWWFRTQLTVRAPDGLTWRHTTVTSWHHECSVRSPLFMCKAWIRAPVYSMYESMHEVSLSRGPVWPVCGYTASDTTNCDALYSGSCRSQRALCFFSNSNSSVGSDRTGCSSLHTCLSELEAPRILLLVHQLPVGTYCFGDALLTCERLCRSSWERRAQCRFTARPKHRRLGARAGEERIGRLLRLWFRTWRSETRKAGYREKIISENIVYCFLSLRPATLSLYNNLLHAFELGWNCAWVHGGLLETRNIFL